MEDPPQPEVGYPEKDAGRSDWKSTCGAEDLTYMAMGIHGSFCAGADVVQRMKQEQVEVARMQGKPEWEVGLGGRGAASCPARSSHEGQTDTKGHVKLCSEATPGDLLLVSFEELLS